MSNEYEIPSRRDWLEYEYEKQNKGLKDVFINQIENDEYAEKIKLILKKLEI